MEVNQNIFNTPSISDTCEINHSGKLSTSKTEKKKGKGKRRAKEKERGGERKKDE